MDPELIKTYTGNLRNTMDLPPESDCEDTTELPPLDFSPHEGLLGFSGEHAPGQILSIIFR